MEKKKENLWKDKENKNMKWEKTRKAVKIMKEREDE